MKHKVFQNMPFGHLGGLNFANLGTCGHSYSFISRHFARVVIFFAICSLPILALIILAMMAYSLCKMKFSKEEET